MSNLIKQLQKVEAEMNEPSVTVPASIFLYLARLYKQQSLEDQIKADYLKITRLEQRAYRKLRKWTKEQK